MAQTGGVGPEAFPGFDFPFDFPLSKGSDSHCTSEQVQLAKGNKVPGNLSCLRLKPYAEGIICLVQLTRGWCVLFLIYI